MAEIREARGCPDLDDPSETELDTVPLHEWDFVVYNNKLLKYLEWQAGCIATVIKNGRRA